ncbi:MAG: M48 family metallopeptidase [Gammaproteobacteria bacterium]|nr:M48 family metallopeptidase [Gammaproteobacteria bacterium]
MARNSIFDQSSNTPLDYSLRVSTKARHARLQIKPYQGLEVVIPVRFPKRAVPELVHQHYDWIVKQLNKNRLAFPKPELPSQIPVVVNDSVIAVNAEIFTDRSYAKCIDRLRQMVREKAWELLPAMLQSVSMECDLAFKKISIRSQKTRWGSCSSRGTISLNDQLIFVSAETARYLMIHELCHTRHMNHSAEFWRLVESHCADYRYHEKRLNDARRHIPEWYQYSLHRTA